MNSSIWKAAWAAHKDHLLAMVFVTYSIVAIGWVLMQVLGAALFVLLLVIAPLLVSWVFIARQLSFGNKLHARAVYFGYRNYARSLLTAIYMFWPALFALFLSYMVGSIPLWFIVLRNIDATTIPVEEILLLTTTEQLYAWLQALTINMTEFVIGISVVLFVSYLVAIYFYGFRQFSVIASMDAIKAPLPAIEAVLKTYTKKHQWVLFGMNVLGWVPILVVFVLFIVFEPIPFGASDAAQLILNGLVALVLIVPYKIYHTFWLTEWYDRTIFQALKQTRPIPPETPIV